VTDIVTRTSQRLNSITMPPFGQPRNDAHKQDDRVLLPAIDYLLLPSGARLNEKRN